MGNKTMRFNNAIYGGGYKMRLIADGNYVVVTEDAKEALAAYNEHIKNGYVYEEAHVDYLKQVKKLAKNGVLYV